MIVDLLYFEILSLTVSISSKSTNESIGGSGYLPGIFGGHQLTGASYVPPYSFNLISFETISSNSGHVYALTITTFLR